MPKDGNPNFVLRSHRTRPDTVSEVADVCICLAGWIDRVYISRWTGTSSPSPLALHHHLSPTICPPGPNSLPCQCAVTWSPRSLHPLNDLSHHYSTFLMSPHEVETSPKDGTPSFLAPIQHQPAQSRYFRHIAATTKTRTVHKHVVV